MYTFSVCRCMWDEACVKNTEQEIRLMPQLAACITSHRWLSTSSEWGALLSSHHGHEHREHQSCRSWSCGDAAAAFSTFGAHVIVLKLILLLYACRSW